MTPRVLGKGKYFLMTDASMALPKFEYFQLSVDIQAFLWSVELYLSLTQSRFGESLLR